MTHSTIAAPCRVLTIEITEPLPHITRQSTQDQPYLSATILVRHEGRPIGVVQRPIPADGILPSELESIIQAELGTELGNLQSSSAKPLAPLPMTVVIATHNRTDSLADTLRTIQAQTYPDFKVIVVDNAPNSDETKTFLESEYGDDARFTYIREDEPGLAVAHNAALPYVTTPWVAFTDDDVYADENWLQALAFGFESAPSVGCVTGMIFPAELDTDAQLWLEQFSGFSKGFRQKIFDPNKPPSPLFPYAAGAFGSGANMAFRTDTLTAIGGFDPALGAGSKGIGGDDLAAFFDVLTHGYTLVYEPSALVHHRHRRAYAGLEKTAWGYGVGLTAYLTRCMVTQPKRILDMLGRLPLGLKHLFSQSSSKNARKKNDYPSALNRAERRGLLAGPKAYWVSRRYVKSRGLS